MITIEKNQISAQYPWVARLNPRLTAEHGSDRIYKWCRQVLPADSYVYWINSNLLFFRQHEHAVLAQMVWGSYDEV